MKLLGAASAGGFSALACMTTAGAADLPSRKAAPVEYVRVCDAYGAGFYWVPGTDTCLKVGGRVRVDMWYTPAKNAVAHRSTVGNGVAANAFISANAVDQYGWNARGFFMMDARTQSAWGTVQTVVTLRVGPGSGLAVATPNYTTGVFAGGDNVTLVPESAYVRFAGFTVGQAASNFLFLPAQYHSVWYAVFVNAMRQIAYTSTFGNGFSATVALENRGELGSSIGSPRTLGANPFTATQATAAAGPLRFPSVVANLRVDQSWGAAMISGALTDNTASFTNAPLAVVGNAGPLMRRAGWAVSAGLRINLPMLAAGDTIQAWAAYGVGALSYVTSPNMNNGSATTGNFLGGFLRADRDLTVFCMNAACTVGGVEQTKAFTLAGLFTHYWTSSLRSNLVASYTQITPGSISRATSWANGGLSRATAWNVMGSVIWSPVRNFDIGLELSYAKLNQSLPLSVPAGLGTLASVNPSNWTIRSRVERTF